MIVSIALILSFIVGSFVGYQLACRDFMKACGRCDGIIDAQHVLHAIDPKHPGNKALRDLYRKAYEEVASGRYEPKKSIIGTGHGLSQG